MLISVLRSVWHFIGATYDVVQVNRDWVGNEGVSEEEEEIFFLLKNLPSAPCWESDVITVVLQNHLAFP